MAELPNLAGVATQDLVERIGSGSYSASFINWSRSMNLIRQHAPGWMAECVYNSEGSLLHRAPHGAYLLIRFRHLDGTVTPEVPQAVMDNRNNAIPYEKITARDVTDTQRRGTCLAAAFIFGLAYELWAKLPMESGFDMESGGSPEPATGTKPNRTTKAVEGHSKAQTSGATKEQFMEAAIARGLTTHSIEALLAALKGKYDAGIKRLTEKDDAWVSSFNEANAPKDNAEQW